MCLLTRAHKRVGEKEFQRDGAKQGMCAVAMLFELQAWRQTMPHLRVLHTEPVGEGKGGRGRREGGGGSKTGEGREDWGVSLSSEGRLPSMKTADCTVSTSSLTTEVEAVTHDPFLDCLRR